MRRSPALLGVALAIAGSLLLDASASARPSARAQHVILLSVDGLHQTDLRWYASHHPSSALARLVADGIEYTGARTPVPSDSFPGLTALVTGGDPGTTGIYYDDSYNRALLPAGTTTCAGARPGTEVTYFEQLDRNPLALDAGQGLSGLPDAILGMTGSPSAVIDPARLPVDPATCMPVYPHSYLEVNTIFEVARAAGLRTAWSDKHPAYDLVNGPSGTGVQDLFTPEINSEAPAPGSPGDWTSDNALTQRYDTYKVRAVLNEIAGLDHTGTTSVGTPAIFGMNFQSVSTAQKLPASNGLDGGYTHDGDTPGPLLRRALGFVDAQIGAIRTAVDAQGLSATTTIVLTAKHGQSPTSRSALTRIPDGPILDALEAAWKHTHPKRTSPLVAFAIDDDAMVIWLHDRSRTATRFVARFLLAHAGTGNGISGRPKRYGSSGLRRVYAGRAAARFFHAPPGDARVPDLYGIAQYGVVYTGKQAKIAEHGGADPHDTHVPLVIAGGPVVHRSPVRGRVETTQVAPTILKLLGLRAYSLQAVMAEHTRPLALR